MKFSATVVELSNKYINKSTASLAKWKTAPYLQLLEETSFLPDSANCRQRMFHVLNDLYEVPSCVCGSSVKWVQTYKPARYAEFCSIKCSASADSTTQKKKQTCLDKYGVDSWSKTDQHKDRMAQIDQSVLNQAKAKRAETCLAKYGVEHITQAPEVIDKRKETTLERYGHTNVLASQYVKDIKTEKYGTAGYTGVEAFKEQRKHTMIDRYGVEYSGQSPVLLKQRYDSCLARYGTPFPRNVHISPESMSKLLDGDWLREQHVCQQRTLSDIAGELGVDLGTVRYRVAENDIDVKRFQASTAERELCTFLTTHNIDYTTNDRTILNGKELDIVIPGHNLAIEYCGLYWHSTAHARNRPSYHASKTRQCNEQGYRLITIFEDEWMHARKIVESKILAVLGIDDRKRAFARKCSIIEVAGADKKAFFDTHHIQGAGPGSLSYGLVSDGELVACMTFIRQSGGVFVLNRYATACNVVGGFTKLLKHFQRNNEWSSILSFADLRWSQGGVYSNSGFTLDKTLPPDYEYVDLRSVKRIHKFNFRHKNLPNILGDRYDPSESETQNTARCGWYKIYNCGLLRYVMPNRGC